MWIAIGAELAEFDQCLAVLCAAGQAIVIQSEQTIFDVEIGSAIVVAYATGIGGGVVAVSKNDAGDGVILRAAELPSTAGFIAGGVAAGDVIQKVGAKIPDRRIGRIERANRNGICGCFGEIDAKSVGAGRDRYFIAGLGRFDFGIVVVGGDGDDRRPRGEADKERRKKEGDPESSKTAAHHQKK